MSLNFQISFSAINSMKNRKGDHILNCDLMIVTIKIFIIMLIIILTRIIIIIIIIIIIGI